MSINIETCQVCGDGFVASIEFESLDDEVSLKLERGDISFGGVPSFSACGAGPICKSCLDKRQADLGALIKEQEERM